MTEVVTLNIRDLPTSLIDDFSRGAVDKIYDRNHACPERRIRMKQMILSSQGWTIKRFLILILNIALMVIQRLIPVLGHIFVRTIGDLMNHYVIAPIIRSILKKEVCSWSLILNREGEFITEFIKPDNKRELKLLLIDYLVQNRPKFGYVIKNLWCQQVKKYRKTKVPIRMDKVIVANPSVDRARYGDPNIASMTIVKSEPNTNTMNAENNDLSGVEMKHEAKHLDQTELDEMVMAIEDPNIKSIPKGLGDATSEANQKRQNVENIELTKLLLTSKKGHCCVKKNGKDIVITVMNRASRWSQSTKQEYILTDDVRMQERDCVQMVLTEIKEHLRSDDLEEKRLGFAMLQQMTNENNGDLRRTPCRLVCAQVMKPVLPIGELLMPVIRVKMLDMKNNIQLRRIMLPLRKCRMQTVPLTSKGQKFEMLVAFTANVKIVNVPYVQELTDALVFHGEDVIQPIAYVHKITYKPISDKFELTCHALQNTVAIERNFQ